MNILHITQSLDPSWGGIARVLPMLAAELNTAGETCRIAVLRGDRFGTPQAVPGVEVLAFEAKPRSPLGRSPGFNRDINDLVRDADVVHLHGLWSDQNRTAGRAARRLGRPMILTPHSMMMPWAWRRSAWKKRPIGWLFEHRNLRTAACLHALAEGEAGHIRALGFNPRVEIIPNGLHTADFETLPSAESLETRFPECRDKRWVLILGRIAEQKGIISAAQACFDVLAAGKDWHLVVAGPDEFGMQRMIQAAADRKGMADRITFTGMLEREEVLGALGRSSILLQPSLSEGLSLSILEAMAAGLPVLISDACNLPEVESAGAGRVVVPDRRAIAAALREMVALSDNDRRALGQCGRKLARAHFDWSALIPIYRRMYQNSLGSLSGSHSNDG
ncbi:MAG: glycosyltransferase [Phycisphaerae bacterium]